MRSIMVMVFIINPSSSDFIACQHHYFPLYSRIIYDVRGNSSLFSKYLFPYRSMATRVPALVSPAFDSVSNWPQNFLGPWTYQYTIAWSRCSLASASPQHRFVCNCRRQWLTYVHLVTIVLQKSISHEQSNVFRWGLPWSQSSTSSAMSWWWSTWWQRTVSLPYSWSSVVGGRSCSRLSAWFVRTAAKDPKAV